MNYSDDFFNFRNGKLEGPDGLYITKAQLRFYLNRGKVAEYSFFNQGSDFVKYFQECEAYNFLSDLMNEDPSSASLCWDESIQDVVFSIPKGGEAAKALMRIRRLGMDGD